MTDEEMIFDGSGRGRPMTDEEKAERGGSADADEDAPKKLTGDALAEAVKDAGIEGASSMTADEKREAVADAQAEEAGNGGGAG